MTNTTLTARPVTAPAVLRPALAADAAITAANGVVYLAAAGPVGDLLGLAPPLLRAVGAFLLAFAAVVALAARERVPRRRPVAAIVVANALWALDSLAVAAIGWGTPSAAGTAWIIAQGLAVAALGAAQAVGLRREAVA